MGISTYAFSETIFSSIIMGLELSLKERIHKLLDRKVVPTLAAVLVGNDAASKIYVNSKHKTFIKNNCNSIVHQL